MMLKSAEAQKRVEDARLYLLLLTMFFGLFLALLYTPTYSEIALGSLTRYYGLSGTAQTGLFGTFWLCIAPFTYIIPATSLHLVSWLYGMLGMLMFYKSNIDINRFFLICACPLTLALMYYFTDSCLLLCLLGFIGYYYPKRHESVYCLLYASLFAIGYNIGILYILYLLPLVLYYTIEQVIQIVKRVKRDKLSGLKGTQQLVGCWLIELLGLFAAMMTIQFC